MKINTPWEKSDDAPKCPCSSCAILIFSSLSLFSITFTFSSSNSVKLSRSLNLVIFIFDILTSLFNLSMISFILLLSFSTTILFLVSYNVAITDVPLPLHKLKTKFFFCGF